MNSTAIQTALRARGVGLGDATTELRLNKFEEDMGLSLALFFRALYLQFDGFVMCDEKSQISLWPLERVLQNRSLAVRIEEDRFFAMGDVLVDSEFLMFCFEKEATPVFLLYEKRELARTATAFFQKFISGDFDFYERRKDWGQS
jgi:hypothetical protein